MNFRQRLLCASMPWRTLIKNTMYGKISLPTTYACMATIYVLHASLWHLMTCICREIWLNNDQESSMNLGRRSGTDNALESFPAATFTNSPNLLWMFPPVTWQWRLSVLAYIQMCTSIRFFFEFLQNPYISFSFFLLCLPLHKIKEISHSPWPTHKPMFLDVQDNDLLGCVQKPAHWDDIFVYKERLHVRVCLLCLQIMIVIPCHLCMCSCMIVWQLMTCICRELHLQRNALTSIPVDTSKNSPNLK